VFANNPKRNTKVSELGLVFRIMRAYQNKRVGKSLSGKVCKLPHRTAPLPLPLPVARANPLPRVPRPPRTGIPFRPIREGGAGVENLDTVFEEGGFSTKDVSVVLLHPVNITLTRQEPSLWIDRVECASVE
jgi:hypothetical protein